VLMNYDLDGMLQRGREYVTIGPEHITIGQEHITIELYTGLPVFWLQFLK
jgi:hypothetical protein